MNKKEISEIRRRFKPDKSSISRVRGCFVNDAKEIISHFDQSFGQLSEEECEMILNNLRKTLSGDPGKTLYNIEFDTDQVGKGEEHKLLMTLRKSSLSDNKAVEKLYAKIIESYQVEGSFLILLASDAYDVPYRSADGERLSDASDEVFSYFLCSVCPVKYTKPTLGYITQDSALKCLKPNCTVSNPEIGFMFPSFDDRSTNLYGALFYTKDSSDSHELFTHTIFNQRIPMPAGVQQTTFESILVDTLGEDCSYHVVQAIQSRLNQMVEAHQISEDPDPLFLRSSDVVEVLDDCDVTEDHVEAFTREFDRFFGKGGAVNPANIAHTGQTKLSLPDISVSVKSDCSHLVETRVIDGVPYVLIRADEGVEVNGVQIHIH